MKKTQLFISSLILTAGLLFAQQQTGQDNENKYGSFGPVQGKLDSACANPDAKGINASATCVKYTRAKEAPYANIKIYPKGKLVDVTPYASYGANAQKIKMKVYSTAPVGTKIELQLGKKGNDKFPEGVHSQYEAVTTVQNAWEEVAFNFTATPKGSQVASTEVDKVTLLFAPNTNSSETFYFDDIVGPEITASAMDANPVNDNKGQSRPGKITKPAK